MTMLEYIPNEFGRFWVQSKYDARRGIHTPLAYIDINDGNRYDADIFAQIMYWHEPSSENGQPRLTVSHKGHLWLAKNHRDWFAETRIGESTARKCLDRLKKRGLIFYELHGFDGDKTPFIRVNWTEFERRMKLWMKNHPKHLSEKEYEDFLTKCAYDEGEHTLLVTWLPHHPKFAHLYQQTGRTPDTKYPTPDTAGQGGDISGQGGVLPNIPPLIPKVEPNTETTSETTPKTTTEREEKIPAAAAPDIDAFLSDDDIPMPSKAQVVPEVFVNSIKDVDSIESLNIRAAALKSPTDKNPLQEAVGFAFNTRPGAWAGKLGAFLTGSTNLKGKWAEFALIDEPMTPLEIVAFRMWRDDQPERFGETPPPTTPDTLHDRVEEFRGAPNYNTAMQYALPQLRQLLDLEPYEPQPEEEYVDPAIIEAELAELYAGGW